MARSRNRSTFFWVLAGLFLGFIAAVFLYFLPKLEKKYNIGKKDRIDSKVKLFEDIKEFEESKEKIN